MRKPLQGTIGVVRLRLRSGNAATSVQFPVRGPQLPPDILAGFDQAGLLMNPVCGRSRPAIRPWCPSSLLCQCRGTPVAHQPWLEAQHQSLEISHRPTRVYYFDGYQRSTIVPQNTFGRRHSDESPGRDLHNGITALVSGEGTL